ncbi:MAG: hypothetical protein Q8Q29_03785 [Actinomycetota bacterium]|nr:hypothetical protein [Actinomycetota bacterium]
MNHLQIRQATDDHELWAKPQGHLGRLKRALGLLDLVPLVDPLAELMNQAEDLRRQAHALRSENAAVTGTASAKRITSIVNGETLPKPASDRGPDVEELLAARRIVLERAHTWCLDEWETICAAVTHVLRERLDAAAAGDLDPEALRELWIRTAGYMSVAESKLLGRGGDPAGLHRQVAKAETLTVQTLARHTGPGRQRDAYQAECLIAAHKGGAEVGYYSKRQGEANQARYLALPAGIRDTQFDSGVRLHAAWALLDQGKQGRPARPPSVWDHSSGYLVGSGPGEPLRGSW